MSSIKTLCPTSAKKPPKRDYEFIPSRQPGSGILVVTVGSKPTGYAVAEFSIGTTPGRGFTLVKTFGGSDSEVSRYDVYLDRVSPSNDRCTCRGFCYQGRCKHVDALRNEFCTPATSQQESANATA